MINKKNLSKLEALKNKHATDLVKRYVELFKPEKVTVLTGTKDDIDYIRNLSLKNKEELSLALKGHTVHFDGYNDQGRDKANTKILIPKGGSLAKEMNPGDREECLKEIFKLMEGIMKGKEMFVAFYCLGPAKSKFSIPALQITDSAYVIHSENILYRPGYEEFKSLKGSDNFFHFIHSSGDLDEKHNSKNLDKRRMYADIEGKRIFSINNQYLGNSAGLKKFALRLAIKKANNEDWLCEHMFITGLKKGNRTTYLSGAFPSACGKTSTAMVPGQTIVGDDIAYIRESSGIAYGANVEKGMFGIIEDVNPVDDVLTYEALTTPREVIFSNVLVNKKTPYWLGMGKSLPAEGVNHSGEWKKGFIDNNGKEILPAHKNARYTISIEELENVDKNLHNPKGVPISGIIYGGRDSDTSPPVLQSRDWNHGVFIGATLESETTAATIGEAGVRKHDPMANMDFLVVPLGLYIKNHLRFGMKLKKAPHIFSTNYFLKENDKYLNEKVDKKVWLTWMEGRIHGEYGAIETPIGFIPEYRDLKKLFAQIFKRYYSKGDYEKQFSVRISKLIERIERMENIYSKEGNIPKEFFAEMENQKKRLLDSRKKFGDTAKPEDF